MTEPFRQREVKLPDETSVIEGHLWDHLLDPHAADAGKDVRQWILVGPPPVLIINENIVEVIEQRKSSPSFSKWKFSSPAAATEFCVMMTPHSTVIGMM